MSPRDRLLARVPPHSLEAERAVLGALLLDPQALARVRARGLEPAHFYRGPHAVVFRACLGLAGAGRPLDVVLLHDELERRGLLEQVGGTPALLDLTEAVPTSANAVYYADQVLALAARRDAIRAAWEAAERLSEGHTADRSGLTAALARAEAPCRPRGWRRW